MQPSDCARCNNTGGVLIQIGMTKMRCVWCERGKHWPSTTTPPASGKGRDGEG
jgi:hypothetical protein